MEKEEEAMGGGTIGGGRPSIDTSSPGTGDACVQAFWGIAASGGRRDLRYSILPTGLVGGKDKQILV